MTDRHQCNHCDWSARKTIDIAHSVRNHFYAVHYEDYLRDVEIYKLLLLMSPEERVVADKVVAIFGGIFK